MAHAGLKNKRRLARKITPSPAEVEARRSNARDAAPRVSRRPLLVMMLALLLTLSALTVGGAAPATPVDSVMSAPTPTRTSTPIKPAPTPTRLPSPTPGTVSTPKGPHVKGITAGVGMRSGEIEGRVPIAISFSEAMDQASAQGAFSISPAAQGTFKWQSSSTLLYTPGAPLKPNTTYSVSVSTKAKTSSGKPLVAGLSTRFQTDPPPAIVRTLPTDGADEVPSDAVVTINFNRPMIPLTSLDNQPDIAKWVTMRPAVQGRWVWLGTAAVGFHPASPGYLPATTYTVEVKAGWPDAGGVTLAQGTTFRFTTIKPAISSAEPYNGSSEVDLDAPVIVRFNMPMDRASVQGVFSLKRKDRKDALPGRHTWSPDSTVMTFTTASLLEFSRSYTAGIAGQVKAATGSPTELVGGVKANSWEFQTTDPTHVTDHSPYNYDNRPVEPSSSFGFSLNNPLASGQDVARYLKIDPAPQGYVGQLAVEGVNVFTDGVKLLPNTTYNFKLEAGLKDKWGFPVAPHSWKVEIGPLPPGLGIKGGSFQPIYSEGPSRVRLVATNLGKVSLHLYQLDEATMREALQRTSYCRPPDRTNFGTLKREWDVAVPTPTSPDGAVTLYPTLGLTDGADRLPAGYYFLRADAPTPYGTRVVESTAFLIVGRTGVVTKREGDDLLIWAADLGSGAPLPNYPLRVEQLNAGNLVIGQDGATGGDGVLRLKLAPSTNPCLTLVWGEQAGDALVASTSWNRYIESYGYYDDKGYRAGVYTDRPIYRPAQVVYFRGVYRLDDDASYTLPPKDATVNVYASTYSNGEQTQVFTGTATLSALGTFSGQFTLPATAPTGDYSLSFTPPGVMRYGNSSEAASVSFTVEEYRKPDFKVDVETRDEAVRGDPLTATVRAGYYFGGPLANVTTTVNLWTNPYYFSWSDPDTGESYTFGESDYPYYYDYYRSEVSQSDPVLTIEARTDANGVYVADVTRYITTTNGSKSTLIEGQVQDLSNQAVAGNSTVVVHQGLYYIGLRTDSYVGVAGQPLTVTVRTVEWTGKRVQPNTPVKLSFARREWVAPTTEGGEWTPNDVPVGEASVTSDAQGRAVYAFTPTQAGDYRVVAEGRDGRGNVIRTSDQLWVSSRDPGYVPWRFQQPQQIELVADKEEYRIGETARILVTSPYTQATGLLTVERGHIKRHSIVTIQGGAPTIEVPLVDGDLPNVHVSLTLLGQERAPNGAPADWANQVRLRAGYVNLSLDTSGKELGVSIEPQGTPPFEPGSTVTVTVRTRDVAGRPTSGEVSLAVVDEAIYALTGDNMPDLFEEFWGERGSDVSTSTSFSAGEDSQRDRSMPLTGGSGVEPMPTAVMVEAAGGMPRSGGDEAQAEPKKVRADFRDTAFWRATITTGADGTAQVAVPFPDNLTTWRLTAHAITGDTRFGSKAETVMVTQPLLLRPVQPRFLTTGDNPRPQAIIHNNTKETLQVEASLVVSGALTLDPQPPAAQRLSVAPGAQAVVTWSVRVGKGDAANMRYWVRTFDKKGKDYLEDAVAMTLPVKPFAAPEAVATSGEVTGTSANEGIFLPYSVSPALGELVVQIAPSLAAAATDSVRYVKEYPYECSEQTTSRYLPLVVLDQVYKEQGRKTTYSAELPGIVERAFKRLGELQHGDGGWGWWELGESQWYNTAYVVQGLVAARDAGYTVPGEMLPRGIERLRQFQLDNNPQGLDETHRLNMRAYSLHVLSLATGGDDALKQVGKDLTGQAARLSTHAKAWLALGLGKMGLKAESKKVLDSLIASARQSSTTAHWEESRPDYWSMGTNTRATALAIDAIVTLAPNDPLLPKAVRWLMTAQREGHWASTQETSISIIALAHYIRQTKELTADYKWQVSAFDKPLGSGVANSANLTQTVTMRLPVSQVPQNDLGNLALTRSSTKGKMYYSVSLRYYIPGEGIKSRSEGMTIARSYYKVTGGKAGDTPIKEVQAGDLVKVRLTIAMPETSYYVLVTDPLPAGLEGVNGSLNTTSFTERPPNPMGTRIEDEGRSPMEDPYYYWYWRWGPFSNVEMRDDRTVLFADYMSPGTYVYEYYARATTPGTYMGLPAHAEMMYYPDVFGHSDGGAFTVR